MRYVGYVACMGKLCIAFAWETWTERPFGRPGHRRVDNIKTHLQETGWQTWIGLIWFRTGTCGRPLQTWWNFGFGKKWRVCRLPRNYQLLKDSTPCT